jgi:hypothetical protein
LISGFGRVGKSRLARLLASKYQYKHFKLDEIKLRLKGATTRQDKIDMLESYCTKLLNEHPKGIILEGNGLILLPKELDPSDRSLDASLVSRLCHQTNCHVFLLGNADCDFVEKREAIRNYGMKHNCWTNGITEKELDEFVYEMIEGSGIIREWDDGNRIHYIEIENRFFSRSLEGAANRIFSLTSR